MKITVVVSVGPIRLPLNLEKEFTFILNEAMKALDLTDAPGEVKLSFYPTPVGEIGGFGEFEDAPGIFGININPVSAPDDLGGVAQIICHDMVHVKQMVTGRLKFQGKDAIWDGTRYADYVMDDSQPWEVEASERAEEVFLAVSREKAAQDGINFSHSVLN